MQNPMSRAHELRRQYPSRTFADCLKQAWREVKATEAAKAAPATPTRRAALTRFFGAVAGGALFAAAPAHAATTAAPDPVEALHARWIEAKRAEQAVAGTLFEPTELDALADAEQEAALALANATATTPQGLRLQMELAAERWLEDWPDGSLERSLFMSIFKGLQTI